MPAILTDIPADACTVDPPAVPSGAADPARVRVEVLGPIRLVRGGVPVDDQVWRTRDRVRQLMAFLTIHPRVSRRRVEAALWPDLGDDKAAANLRVTLNYLQRVLEPDREAYTAPRFVRCEGDSLALVDEHLAVDLREAERDLAEARRLDMADEAGLALAAYLRVIGTVRGDYLDDCAAGGWAEMERFRVATLVVGARCRAGELLAARGEPERAAALAAEVLAGEPCQERAGRLLAGALAAQGDGATARRVLAELVDRLAGLGVAPEPETARLATQFSATAVLRRVA
ncbi:MAG TPA: BTAD domain-containing putative transcriptional regulator [Ilumatobacter sp.]|nr:BTAD domain-containing putative transcriptional regulator [Ilumatobacter sp.]